MLAEPVVSESPDVAGQLPGLPGWREVVRYVPGMVVRVVVPCVVIVGFFSVPFGEILPISNIVVFEVLFIVFWSTVFLLFLRWQLRSIHSSATPETRWLEALIVLGVLFVSLFARVYRVLSLSAPTSFSIPLTVIDSYFYTLGTLSTTGTGDVEPRGDLAKTFTMLQIVANLAFIGLIVRVLTGAARTAKSRRAGSSGAAAN